MTSVVRATEEYEQWLGAQIPLIPRDLARKHKQMREAPFPLLRATFYRWAATFPETCPRLMHAPEVWGVGDLHVDNFGTWRDAEGRLVWGVNDFDEACRLPYTADLVRLATSALLQHDEQNFGLTPERICRELLEGYQGGLVAEGRPFVLAEQHGFLRELAIARLKEPEKFWAKLRALSLVKEEVPAAALKSLRRQFPARRMKLHIVHRISGLGSLGRRRYTALAEWQGSAIAREAKELTVSAWNWVHAGPQKIFGDRVLKSAVRAEDPFLRIKDRWVVRRLAPDCCRIELRTIASKGDIAELLRAMGWEAANVHLGGGGWGRILADLTLRRPAWLVEAATSMASVTAADWKSWKKAAARSLAAGSSR